MVESFVQLTEAQRMLVPIFSRLTAKMLVVDIMGSEQLHAIPDRHGHLLVIALPAMQICHRNANGTEALYLQAWLNQPKCWLPIVPRLPISLTLTTHQLAIPHHLAIQASP